ncbi:putative pectinesterase/pectinesterase inhibitor 22 [Senna tora]|uniref:pectinesterase n=1 Tax=Senna tora TaxID=362788 RepID=A0A834X3P6_9FABA|nr:putative pectinesterase/pectinesterase inhibitor 22 [Senna tora]
MERAKKVAAVVSKDGDGEYRSISEAIAEAPNLSSEKYTIYVEGGIYEEYISIPTEKTNIMIVGKGKQYTRIIGNRSTSTGTALDQTATVAVYGSGFVAKNIAFVNNAGREAGQGVALLNRATQTAFYRCSFEGYQDTLWAASGRQFYRECEVYGTVDFIMGNAAAVFQNSKLYARPKLFITFTAQSRAGQYEPTAFVFQFCKFTISPEAARGRSEVARATLGRPWRAYSRVVIMESYIDSIIDPKGWEVYDSVPTDKLSYIEYGNGGGGAKTDGRMTWPGVQAVSDAQKVVWYTASKFLHADAWIPQTGIPYHGGL